MNANITPCYKSDKLENDILYAILNYQNQQHFIFENLDKKFFQDATNSLIFDYARSIYFKGEEIDATAICEHFKDDNINQRVADIYTYSDTLEVFTSRNCKLLFKNYKEKLIKEAKTEEDYAQIKELENSVLFEENKIFQISSNIENFDKSYKSKQDTAIFTFYSQLDNFIGSFIGGDYIILGAATGMGKTSIALNIARNVCMQDKTVLYFSLEMPLDQVQNRFVCMNEGLNANKYRQFDFNLVEMQNYKQGLSNLQEWNLNVVCDYNLTPEKMRMYVQKQKKKALDFVVLDYLGLMSGYGNKSLYEKTTILSRKIKLLAGEFNVPVLCLVQLNRDLKTRQDKRPKLSDIRESGAIEQDADFILFAHREGYYDKNKAQNKLEIIIAKNRHGASNKIINLDFNLETQLIKEF